MDLISYIPDGETLLALPPEDLAVIVLRSLNAHNDNQARRSSGRRENFSISNYCVGQSRSYPDIPEPQSTRTIAAAFQHLINIGMLVPNVQSNPYGWFVLSDRGKSVRTDAD